MKKNNKYILIGGLAIFFILIAFFAMKINTNDIKNNQENLVGELPIRNDEIPVKFNIIKDKSDNVLEYSYINSSKYDISNLRLEVKLKDTDEIIELECNEVVNIGKESNIFKGKAPKSGKVEDVEILKYKISLSKGVYMEYDVQLNQYNWS